MQAHHRAWLIAHPDRSKEWLQARLKDGFDVHHLDNDHTNNDPLNLVLIDHVDHVRLFHGFPGNRVTATQISRERAKERRAAGTLKSMLAKERAKALRLEQDAVATELLAEEAIR